MKAVQTDRMNARLMPARIGVVGQHGAVTIVALDGKHMPPAPGYHPRSWACRGKSPPVRRQIEIANGMPKDVDAGAASAERRARTPSRMRDDGFLDVAIGPPNLPDGALDHGILAAVCVVAAKPIADNQRLLTNSHMLTTMVSAANMMMPVVMMSCLGIGGRDESE